MTKQAALHAFFNSLSLTAYPDTSVPDDVTLPYRTYTVTTAGFGDSVSLTVQDWHYSESESVPNAKAEELFDAIGAGGVQISCDDGTIWIKRGTPWCVNKTDQNDRNIKMRYMNVTAQFHTID